MCEFGRLSEEVMGWVRKPGPLRVWRVVEGRKKSEDGKTLRFSIQEIPEDRYAEVLDHMCTIFLRDELLCQSLDVINKPGAIEDFRRLWNSVIGHGIIVGAFVVDENNPKPRLAGVNMTLLNCEASEKSFKESFKCISPESEKIFGVMSALDAEINVRKLYGVDKYIAATGLSVDPEYRGQGLGYHLLKARDDMAKAYDIRATTTLFSSIAAQKVAAQAGFNVLRERNYVDFKDEGGTQIFPEIPYKSCKVMGKMFS